MIGKLHDLWQAWFYETHSIVGVQFHDMRPRGYVTIAALILTAIFALGFLATYGACNNLGHTVGLDTRFDILAGCFVEVEDGRWIPDAIWRITEGL
jgi:hypothetical protein